jgi:hypothetical protein
MIAELNRLQMEGYTPAEIVEYIFTTYNMGQISELKKLPTGNMGDSVLIAISMI